MKLLRFKTPTAEFDFSLWNRRNSGELYFYFRLNMTVTDSFTDSYLSVDFPAHFYYGRPEVRRWFDENNSALPMRRLTFWRCNVCWGTMRSLRRFRQIFSAKERVLDNPPPICIV